MVGAVSYWDMRQRLAAGDVRPHYLFFGAELFLKRTLAEGLKKSLIPVETEPFNYNFYYAGDTALETVLDGLRTQPFLSAKRMVVVRNAEKLMPRADALVRYLENPAAPGCLVLDTDKNAPDPFVKKISAYTTCVALTRLRAGALERWVSEYSASKAKSINGRAVTLLLEKIGEDLDLLAGAVDKLCVYTAGVGVIQAADVENLVKKTKLEDRFALADALSRRRADRALAILSELAREGKHAADIIGLLNWQLKRLESVKILTRQGKAPRDIAAVMGISDFALRKAQQQIPYFGTGELEQGLRLLLEIDAAIKQGVKNPAPALETFIVRMCRRRISSGRA